MTYKIFRKKTGFLYSSGRNSETKRDIVMGLTGEMVLTHSATNAVLTKKWFTAIFDRVFPFQSREMPLERELPAKDCVILH